MELFGVGPLELLVIGVVSLLIFGPKKLPELAETVGKTVRSLKSASRDFEREIKREFDQPEPSARQPISSLVTYEQQESEIAMTHSLNEDGKARETSEPKA